MTLDILRLTEFPLGPEEIAAKRERLTELRGIAARTHSEMFRLEAELGNAICEKCGYAHLEPCSAEQLLERRG